MIGRAVRNGAFFGMIGFLCAILLFPAEKINERDLPAKYREWLKLVTYIIRPEEKDVFLRLGNDRERDLFIETFWKMRDPTPGTPENEYKQEHIRRFIHANQVYGRNTPREGWMTDMGRIYIILGEPKSREIFETSGLYPCEVWTYYGEKGKGLPTQFNIVFFQPSGAGEYKLYNPTAHGPAALIINKQDLDLSDYQALYEKIRELAPTLAGPAVTMIPGQYPYNYHPSPRNNMIIANIFESPKKDINPTYATHFLNYKGVVSTEYLTNYVESHTDVGLIQDPVMNIHFLHFSISPSRMSIDYFEPKDQYYCSFDLNVSLREGERVIFQYSKKFPFYFDPDKVDLIQTKGVAIQDAFPVIEGTYELSILIQNSVGKEFSVFEKEIHVPEGTEGPRILGPLVGYKLQDYPAHLHVPFKVLDKQLLVDPKATIAASEDIALFFSVMGVSRDLWERGRVDVRVQGLKENNPSQKAVTLFLKDFPFHEVMAIKHAIPAKAVAPDYYEIEVTLKDGEGTPLDQKAAHCIISPSEGVPHPVTLAKSFPLSNYYLFLYALAGEYEKKGRMDEAETTFERAFSIRPDYHPGAVEVARFLQRRGKYQESLEMIETVRDDGDLRFDYFLIKGLGYMGLEKYFAALDHLLEANKIYNSDVRLLNALGYCFYKTGEKQRALEALRASLGLNPEQENVKALIKRIEKDDG